MQLLPSAPHGNQVLLVSQPFSLQHFTVFPPSPPSLAHARQVLVKSMLAVKQSHVPLPHREREEEGEVFKAKVYTNHVTLLHQQLVAIVILSIFIFF